MSNLINEISCAGAEDLQPILETVLRRYRVLFPDWEIVTVSFEKNGDKNAQIDHMIDLLCNLKTPS